MSEIPERIEREMFEIRSRMAPDVRDLKRHVEPQAVTKRVTERVKDRVRGAVARAKGAASGAGRNLADSARRQARMIGEAGKKRNPGPLTDAVKRDPRPAVLVAVVLALSLLTVRRISNGSNGRD